MNKMFLGLAGVVAFVAAFALLGLVSSLSAKLVLAAVVGLIVLVLGFVFVVAFLLGTGENHSFSGTYKSQMADADIDRSIFKLPNNIHYVLGIFKYYYKVDRFWAIGFGLVFLALFVIFALDNGILFVAIVTAIVLIGLLLMGPGEGPDPLWMGGCHPSMIEAHRFNGGQSNDET